MERLSRFTFGASVFETTLPPRAWTPSDNSIGGSRIAASGTPAAYLVRRDAQLEITLRFYESEWAAVDNLIAWGQSAQPITWAPEASDPGTTVDVYLDSPGPGERFSPTRSDFPRVFELTITVRGKDGAVPWTPYYAMD